MTTTTFQYRVRDQRGALRTGKLEAESTAQVAGKLKSMGYAPVSITRAGTGLNREISLPGRTPKVKLKDLAVFSRQFAVMIDSGLSLLRSLSILTEQTENKELGRILGEVRNDIQVGNSLSGSLAKHPRTFPPLMINLVRAGEVGGFLDGVLLQLAENYEAEVRLRGKVKSAMTYPVVVFVIALLAVIGMLLFIVPVFAGMFEDLGGELPLATKFLVFLSGVMRVAAPVGLVAVVALFLTWPTIKDAPRLRSVLDPLKLRLPVFGSLVRKIALSRFTRNLGTMLRSGVPILQALDIVGATCGNVVLQRAVDDVRSSVSTGESLSGPLVDHPVFPPMVVQMMSVGEDTGALDGMLHKISDFYDQEVEATTEALTSLIEPLTIAVLGAIVGAMIVALYMPILECSSSSSRRARTRAPGCAWVRSDVPVQLCRWARLRAGHAGGRCVPRARAAPAHAYTCAAPDHARVRPGLDRHIGCSRVCSGRPKPERSRPSRTTEQGHTRREAGSQSQGTPAVSPAASDGPPAGGRARVRAPQRGSASAPHPSHHTVLGGTAMLARLRHAKEDGEAGFTLIELLVVMIIIGILAAIAVPVFLSQRAKARDTATKADVSTIGKEISAYYVDQTGPVFVAVDATTRTATLYAGANATAPVITTTDTSEGTAFNNQTAASTATTFCVSLTNPDGSTSKIWKYSAAAGLEPGGC